MYSKLAVHFGLKKAQENSNERVNSRVRQAEESITKEAQQNLNVFIDKMSVSQIRQAEKMVNEWLRNFKIRNGLIAETSHKPMLEANLSSKKLVDVLIDPDITFEKKRERYHQDLLEKSLVTQPELDTPQGREHYDKALEAKINALMHMAKLLREEKVLIQEKKRLEAKIKKIWGWLR